MPSTVLDRTPCKPDYKSWVLRTVEVSGISQCTTHEYLQLFFENPRRSGGGDIVDLQYDSDKGSAIITFKDADCKYIDAAP